MYAPEKKSTLAHLHAERLGSSCEQRIEMEMGRGERADYAPQTACTASWLAHQLSRERERNMGGCVMGTKRENGGSRVRQQQSEESGSKCGEN